MKSAPPIAPPGWPDLAFSTMAADKMRILSAALVLICLLIFLFFFIIFFWKFPRRTKNSKKGNLRHPFFIKNALLLNNADHKHALYGLEFGFQVLINFLLGYIDDVVGNVFVFFI